MSHTSPASLLVWSIICCVLGAFLIFHLWSFDRFKCLKWSSGSSGTFKRVMTYSYLLSIPLLTTYSVGFAIIKYREGFFYYPSLGIIPRPYQLWSPSSQNAIFPLMLLFSIGWSFEIVTHLEELCFWLFLVNAGSSQRNWFQSLYFKFWMVGSIIAVLYMPLVTIFTRSDPLKCEAYTFLAGSLADLSLTLWFTPILFIFPGFLEHLKSEGVDTNTMVRLTKFSELNNIRVVFRFLFVVPLLILAADGVRPHPHVNESMFATDFLAMMGGFGCAISSGITLVIFFPRSIEGEIAERDAKRARSFGRSPSVVDSRFQTYTNMTQQSIHTDEAPGVLTSGTHLLPSSPTKHPYDLMAEREERPEVRLIEPSLMQTTDKIWDEEELDTVARLAPIRPNRRKGTDIQLGGFEFSRSETTPSRTNKVSKVNPLLRNFTSPINLMDGTEQNRSTLTFSRR